MKSTWRDYAAMLQAILAGARTQDQDQTLMMECIAGGLISREEQRKPCKACGQSVHDFSYHRITPAGRMLVQAYEDARTPVSDGEGRVDG